MSPIGTEYQVGVGHPEAKSDIGRDVPDAVATPRKDTTEGR
jgi:hypothetical protein